MPRLAQMLQESDPESRGLAFSERELEIIKRFASAQANKEAIIQQYKNKIAAEKPSLTNTVIGGVTGFLTGGPIGAVAGAAAGYSKKGKTDVFGSAAKGAGAGGNLTAMAGGSKEAGTQLQALGKMENIPNTGKYLKSLNDPNDYGQDMKAPDMSKNLEFNYKKQAEMEENIRKVRMEAIKNWEAKVKAGDVDDNVKDRNQYVEDYVQNVVFQMYPEYAEKTVSTPRFFGLLGSKETKKLVPTGNYTRSPQGKSNDPLGIRG